MRGVCPRMIGDMDVKVEMFAGKESERSGEVCLREVGMGRAMDALSSDKERGILLSEKRHH